MIGESLSGDEVNVRSWLPILHFTVVRTDCMSNTRKEICSFRYLDFVRVLRRSSADSQRDAMAMQVPYQSLCS